MTLRSEGQFNTVVYEDEDIYRGNERRDVVMMNEDDARRARAARAISACGSRTRPARMEALVRFAPLPPGNLAMYYPEANVLDSAPRSIRRRATPVFKSTTGPTGSPGGLISAVDPARHSVDARLTWEPATQLLGDGLSWSGRVVGARGGGAGMETIVGLLVTAAIGALVGWVASMVMGTNAQMGSVANVVVGIVGAVLRLVPRPDDRLRPRHLARRRDHRTDRRRHPDRDPEGAGRLQS